MATYSSSLTVNFINYEKTICTTSNNYLKKKVVSSLSESADKLALPTKKDGAVKASREYLHQKV